ncbi:fumarylacetoacetate hydrolase family protein [uncultured Jatrophihabitans sp.]|uniref:fumarylacetoacetate hydrolase family protein n=1 Tax=uncultured Jatrophihabitans sp. TaxID=1610747 RepID=UPI0035CBCD5A
MRIANVDGNLAIVVGDGYIDVSRASARQFGSDVQQVYSRRDELVDWWQGSRGERDIDGALSEVTLRAPVPRPRQVFALGLNYDEHAREAGLHSKGPVPVFTKFPSCIADPFGDIRLPTEFVDWEVELVVVIGRETSEVTEDDAWSHVAGLTVGQDLSERHEQMEGAAPQFSLAKSYAGFGPIGPCVVTVDEIDDPDDLELRTEVNGEIMQNSRTSYMIAGVAETIARLSRVCTLWPGDLIFTGTPGGIGNARNPKVFLRPGDELVSTIETIGTIRQRCK